MRRSTKQVILLAAFVLLTAGCGQAKVDPGKSTAAEAAGSTVQPSPTVTANVKKELNIKTYYADQEGTKLVEKTAAIQFASETEKYIAALNQMKETQDKQLFVLFSGFSFHKAEFKDGNLVVDLSINPASHFGGNGESLTLQALEKSLFQFQEVKSISILVDGKKSDSLMGHVELSNPLIKK